MRTIAIAATTLAALGMTHIASAQDRLPRECRQQIVQLCGTDRSKMRGCLRENYGKLSASCQSELRGRMQDRRRNEDGVDRSAQVAQQSSAISPTASISYGAHERQTIDFYAANDTDTPPPLILFVHGGGWSFGDHKMSVAQKPSHFTSTGYAFAATGYRLMPDAPVEEQAQDIGAAITRLRSEASTLGFDPDNIVLMGHSAGAHLAALASTDPQYAGEAFDAIKGAVLLDGAGYDIASSMAQANPRAARLYANVFGDDPARHAALSPLSHVGGPDADGWLILYVADRGRSSEQSRNLAEGLNSAGAEARAVAVSDTDHRQLNQNLGKSGDQATAEIDVFLAGLFAG